MAGDQNRTFTKVKTQSQRAARIFLSAGTMEILQVCPPYKGSESGILSKGAALTFSVHTANPHLRGETPEALGDEPYPPGASGERGGGGRLHVEGPSKPVMTPSTFGSQALSHFIFFKTVAEFKACASTLGF